MRSFWAMFQERNTGFFSSNAWIRPGHFDGASFAWDHDPIMLPDQLSAYEPDRLYTGYLAVDPNDSAYIWIYGIVDVGSHFYARCWTYNQFTEVWSLLLDVDGGIFDYALCVDMAFDPDGNTFLAIGNASCLGFTAGTPDIQGVFQSVDRGTFAAAGSGHGHGFSSGNINNPHSLTALDLSPDTGEGRVVYTAHTLTRTSGLASTGWVTSFTTDDGATWSDPIPTYNGNQFQLEVLAMMRLGGAGGGLFYCADHSGTGAYSTSGLSAVIDGTPTDGPTGSYGAGIFQSGSIAHTFAADPDKAVGYPTFIATTLELVNSVDGGTTWNRQSQGLEHAPFCYRGGRSARSGLDTAGVSIPNAAHNSELFWSEDAGATWHSDLAEENAIGMSLDFGEFAPAVPRVNLEVLTFRDSRMFPGMTRYYITAGSDAEAEANALGLADALQLLTDGSWTAATGPYNTPPGKPTPGSDAVYRNIEMVIRLVWLTEDGVPIIVEVPAPAQALFIDDQETYSVLNPDLYDAISAGFTYKLCTRGGQLAYVWGGATRIMRGFRATETIRTLDPSETFPAE